MQYTITVDAGRGDYELPEGPYYEGRDYELYIDAPLGYVVDVDRTVVSGSNDSEVYVGGAIILNDMGSDVTISVVYTFQIIDDEDDDEPVSPPVYVPEDDDDSTIYIVAIAAAAVVAILATLILMQTRKS